MKTFLVSAIAAPLMTAAAAMGAPSGKITLQAEEARLDTDRVEVVEQTSFRSGKGAALKETAEAAVEAAEAAPDLVFTVRAPETGRYVFRTHAAVDAFGRELMSRARTKYESLFLKIAVGDARPVRRVVFVPWSGPDSYTETLGKFDLNGQDQEIRVWLPKGVRLDRLEISPYVPPKVPKKAKDYRPAIVPPPSRPRLWVNQETLPRVRANLTRGENARLWRQVRREASRPYAFEPRPGAAVEHDVNLENAAVNKAFVYLMTGEEESGREAVALIRDYLAAVEFDNLLDITREIGRAIYAGARVYDWCYDLLSDEDRDSIRTNLMRLADDMEIGWPPFKQGVVNGHGSEAQLHCHLLSMAIALYDEDPVPYRYCAYRVLEELVPMRDFEYQSPRHNQGIGYGIYRFTWDMHAALLFSRMSGRKIFAPSIENVTRYWLYMRLPNGHSFPDGDGNVDGRPVHLGALALLTSAYANDPLMKREFVRQGGLRHDPVLVLLLNDPDLEPAEDLTSLPLTLDFGPVLGGMVARTGWNFGKGSSDVVVAMTGGGYHFANHQHCDAGSFQIYYRGMQVADLGQYMFYGTPYDTNFNKRSIAHSMMLAVDPGEKFGGRNSLNDGGTRYGFPSPASPDVVKSDPVYANGTVLSADFGPDSLKPDYSYFSVDLASAYSDKIRGYVRSFCFLNLENEHTPAALIILDNMETSGPEVRKYWQVNTLHPPKPAAGDDGDALVLSSGDSVSTGHVILRMLHPPAGERRMEILGGADANSVFGHRLTPPRPEAPQAHGHRVMFTPKESRSTDRFLTVLTMSDSERTTLSAEVTETPETYVLSLADRVVVLSKGGALLGEPFTLNTGGAGTEGECRLVLTGLQPGTWTVRGRNGGVTHEARVQEKKNTAFFRLPRGEYTVEPKR